MPVGQFSPTLNGQCHRSVICGAVSLVLHLADDVYLSTLHCRRVKREATANAVGPIWIVGGHFGADTGEVAHACRDDMGAVLDVPPYR